MKRAAIYLRVSTDEQTTENQRPALERLAKGRGWRVVARCGETVSGVSQKRPELARVLELARRREIDVVAVWAIDRLGRSMFDVVATVLELDRLGVELVSIADGGLLDVDPKVRPLVIAVFAWLAEVERRRLIERTRAGLDRARARGVRLGRPRRVARHELPRILELRTKEGLSLRAIAARLKIPEPTVRRALKRAASDEAAM